MRLILSQIILFSLFASCLGYGAQFGSYTYEVIGQSVRITDYTTPVDFNGQLVIPSQIDSKPVTEIGNSAFSANFDLKTVTMPDTLLKIGDSAFYQCNNVTSFDLGTSVESIGDLAFFVSSSLKSIVLPNSLKTIGERAFDNCKLITLTLPSGLINVGKRAFLSSDHLTDVYILGENTKFEFGVFQDCANLQNVTIAAGLHPESEYLFHGCDALRSITFESDAPATLPPLNPLSESFAEGFSMYFKEGKTGFTTPTWQNYPMAMLGNGANPHAREWLIRHNLDPDMDLSKDHNGDGQSLLLAYALNVDPNSNFKQSMPTVQLDLANFAMKLSFYSKAPGVSYLVEWSDDLKTWKSAWKYSPTDASGRRTASVTTWRDEQKFLRLSVRRH